MIHACVKTKSLNQGREERRKWQRKNLFALCGQFALSFLMRTKFSKTHLVEQTIGLSILFLSRCCCSCWYLQQLVKLLGFFVKVFSTLELVRTEHTTIKIKSSISISSTKHTIRIDFLGTVAVDQIGPCRSLCLVEMINWLSLFFRTALEDIGTFPIGDLLGSTRVGIESSRKDGNDSNTIRAALGSVFFVSSTLARSRHEITDFVTNFIGLIIDNIHIVQVVSRVLVSFRSVVNGFIVVSIWIVDLEADSAISILHNVMNGDTWGFRTGIASVFKVFHNWASITSSSDGIHRLLRDVARRLVLVVLTFVGSSVRPDTLVSFWLCGTGSSIGSIRGGEVSLSHGSRGVACGWSTLGGSPSVGICNIIIINRSRTAASDWCSILSIPIETIVRVHHKVNSLSRVSNLTESRELGCVVCCRDTR
mmetsp:Transcript_45955/g.111316  ORF Transcript_45955/g.111316 Transcript_45955/m.111316 type:complete len:422 (-) Transcript_45955:695-1960(-)